MLPLTPSWSPTWAGASLQLLAVGDQYYEHRPTTREQGPEPTLDVLYRWYLWLWAFRAT